MSAIQDLNDCGCCAGVTVQTPVEVTNRPGLSAIAYRVGTWNQFYQSLLARLSTAELSPLSQLTSRESTDFAIALLDAWATVADVLTFYQERIANESYLRTAIERVSILHLARLIGYELRPGVAASTVLAFTLEDAPGAPRQVEIPAGTKVQSVPKPGEQAQTFETLTSFVARAEWSTLKPRLTRRHPIQREMDQVLFEGIATGLKPGDGLLLIPDGGGAPTFRQVLAVTPQPLQQRTAVQLQPLASSFFAISILAVSPIAPFSPGVGLSAVTNNYLQLSSIPAADLLAASIMQSFRIADLFANVKAVQLPPPTIFALRSRAAIFGHNAPRWNSLPNHQKFGEFVRKRQPTTDDPDATVSVYEDGVYSNRQNSWAEVNLAQYPGESTTSTTVYLDTVYSGIVRDSWVVLKDGPQATPYRVQSVTELSKADFTLNAKVTRLTLNNRTNFSQFSIRTTTVLAQSEALNLARLPIALPIAGAEIELEGGVEGLDTGQTLIVCGELAQQRGTSACEEVTIATVDYAFVEHESVTRVKLQTGLSHEYVRETVTISANVVLATHGETVQEVLGSGNASQPYQTFTLRQPPLTHIRSDANPSGAESTLQVRVNEVLWQEVPMLYGQGARDRVYITRRSDDGKTTVEFGDGQTGARLPTGANRVKATYRKGIGLAGNVNAGQLSLLMSRPLGVKAVTNFLDATGGDDPEPLEQARQNAPLTVLTLNRIVSLQDYEDFARAFAGIAKALATWTWSGQTRGVFVTVAGPQGAAIAPELIQTLVSQMRKSGDPYVPLQVKSYRSALFRLVAQVQVDSTYQRDRVLAAVRQSLQATFAFEARALGQGVALSEVMACMQAVEGVVAVDVDQFYRFGNAAQWNPRLVAAAPQAGAAGAVAAAELLTLDPSSLATVGAML